MHGTRRGSLDNLKIKQASPVKPGIPSMYFFDVYYFEIYFFNVKVRSSKWGSKASLIKPLCPLKQGFEMSKSGGISNFYTVKSSVSIC